jgi:DNA-directed RNA polymerase specialized sigma24 family protein
MELSPEQRRRVVDMVLGGMPDEQIAQALLISVKQVRPIRLALEAEMRPR